MREMKAYCEYHAKKMEDISEYEQEQCEKQGWSCKDCPNFGEIREEDSENL